MAHSHKNTAHGSKALTFSPLTEQRNDAPTFRQSVKHVERCAIQCPEDAAADGELHKPKNQFFSESITESTMPKSRGQKVSRPIAAADRFGPPPSSAAVPGRPRTNGTRARARRRRSSPAMGGGRRILRGFRSAPRFGNPDVGRDWEGNGASEGKKE